MEYVQTWIWAWRAVFSMTVGHFFKGKAQHTRECVSAALVRMVENMRF
ncbi:hypothetical protein HMPREF1987_01178 [Peptostreptococcaceae bacterium oral taxon 113 str. W5053]|nr:hypothetical protein HMPREF1987_01178 [Peptostreptococcaceae bacterium oral taxon 113 str. W5053]